MTEMIFSLVKSTLSQEKSYFPVVFITTPGVCLKGFFSSTTKYAQFPIPTPSLTLKLATLDDVKNSTLYF
jgi:hypothetical protein